MTEDAQGSAQEPGTQAGLGSEEDQPTEHEPPEISYSEQFYPARPRTLRPRARLRGQGGPQHGEDRSGDPLQVDPAVLVEPLVLHRQEGLGDMGGQRVQGDDLLRDRRQVGEDLAMPVEEHGSAAAKRRRPACGLTELITRSHQLRCASLTPSPARSQPANRWGGPCVRRHSARSPWWPAPSASHP